MKQFITILVLNLLIISSYSQIVILDVNNPAPRIGGDIEIKYSIKKTDKKVEYPISPEELKEINKNNIGRGKLTLKNYSENSGKVVFGPFKFNIDGQEYISDTLTLFINPKLPNVKNGFWTRIINFQNEYFLVTKQRVSGEWKKTIDDKDSFSMSFNSDGIEYAKINESSINSDNLEIIFSYSSSKSQTLDGEDIFTSGTVHYMIHVYRIKVGENYDSDFKLKKKHFENFPKRIDFKPILIRK